MSTRVSKPAVLLAWHYTTNDRFEGIKALGLLMPATAGVIAPERPVVWFSLAQGIEPTALKGILTPEGKRRTATAQEMREACGGLVRLGIAPRELLTGETLRHKARINRTTWRALCDAGRRVGADPSQWFGIPEALPLARLVVEVEREPGRWVGSMEGDAQ